MKKLIGTFKKATLCLNFDDETEPRYTGYYYNVLKDFPQPYFERQIALNISLYSNKAAQLYPEAGFDTYETEGNNIIMTDGKDKTRKVVNEPVIITYAGKELTVYPIGHGDWLWCYEDVETVKTNINRELVTIQDAKDYLTELHSNKETYHPEDNAGDCFDISEADAAKMNNLMDRVYELFNTENLDPCEFILKLDPKYTME